MDHPNLEQFLKELTELSRKHGLAINPDGDLWIMEADDYERNYVCDDNSTLDFE